MVHRSDSTPGNQRTFRTVFLGALCSALLLLMPAPSCAEEALKLDIAQAWRSPYRGKVERVTEDGTVIVQIGFRGVERSKFGDPVPFTLEPIEGLYVSWTGVKFDQDDDPVWTSTMIFRAEVTEVKKQNRVVVKVAPAAASLFKRGDEFVLWRPPGSTTAQMKSVPALAPVVTPDPFPDLDSEFHQAFKTSIWNLKVLGLAMHEYHEAHDVWPPSVVYGPDGKPWHSWRVLLLPYLNEEKLFREYNMKEPWNGPNNRKLLNRMPKWFRDPNRPVDKKFLTHYAAITGKTAGFGPIHIRDMSVFNEKGFRSENEPNEHRIRDMLDGISNSLILGTLSSEHNVPWMKPQDIPFTEMPTPLGKPGGFSTPHPFNTAPAGLFLKADGSVVAIHNTIQVETLKRLLDYQDGKPVGKYPQAAIPDSYYDYHLEFVEVDGKPVAKLVYEIDREE